MVNISKPLFSIILPTYNRDDVISCAIESVLYQSVSAFELLIVGDGCTDKTEQIAKKYSAADPRVKWFPFPKSPNFGYKNRNAVLKEAKGKYLAFAAHDDLWMRDHLEIFRHFFEKNGDIHIAYTRPLWVCPDGTILPSAFNTDDPYIKNIFLNIHNEIPADCVVHKTDLIRKAGFYNTRIKKAGDWDLWKRATNAGNGNIGFISAPSTFHFRANWRDDSNSWDSFLVAMHKIIRRDILRKRLVVNPQKGKTLQRIFWEDVVNSDKKITELRKDIFIAIDALAQEATLVAAENKNLKNGIKRIKGTKGYRLMEFIRKLNFKV